MLQKQESYYIKKEKKNLYIFDQVVFFFTFIIIIYLYSNQINEDCKIIIIKTNVNVVMKIIKYQNMIYDMRKIIIIIIIKFFYAVSN